MNSTPFALSYSAGKDSVLSLYRLMQAGSTPVALVNSFNRKLNRSWFHGVDHALLEALAASLGLPLIVCSCRGEEYHLAIEDGLLQAKLLGASACAFGDLDTDANRAWSEARCNACGMQSIFPLWHEDREAVVREFVNAGFRAKIKCIRTDCLDASFLGRDLDHALIDELIRRGIDVAGENGEYHTVVYDGPIFSSPVPLRLGEKLGFGTHAAVDITLDKD